jgi:hypothetical protein
MRKLKFAVGLPLISCAVEIILWLWGQGKGPTVPVYESIRVPAASVISAGLNPIARIGAMLIYRALDRLFGVVGAPGGQFVFLACVLATWYPIGLWLDRRADEEQSKGAQLTMQGILLRLLLLAVGVFFALLSFHSAVSSLSEAIGRAMLQTWSLFLIGLPALALTRRARSPNRAESSANPSSEGRSLSNTHRFAIAGAVFLALLALNLLVWRM